LCRDPGGDRMSFVDAHQAAFADHGVCARAQNDPEFDRQCFSAKGESFDPDIVTAANQPMLCGRSAGEYRAYLPRARWDPRRQRQLLCGDDLSAGTAVFQSARRYP